MAPINTHLCGTLSISHIADDAPQYIISLRKRSTVGEYNEKAPPLCSSKFSSFSTIFVKKTMMLTVKYPNYCF